MSLGQRLRKLRMAKNLTLKQVSEELGIAPSTYRDWEYGKAIRGEPYIALARIFGVSVAEILGQPGHVLTLQEHLQAAKSSLEAAIKITKASR